MPGWSSTGHSLITAALAAGLLLMISNHAGAVASKIVAECARKAHQAYPNGRGRRTDRLQLYAPTRGEGRKAGTHAFRQDDSIELERRSPEGEGEDSSAYR